MIQTALNRPFLRWLEKRLTHESLIGRELLEKSSLETPSQLIEISLMECKPFSAVPAGTCLPASRTRHSDAGCSHARNPVRRTGLFSFAANAARSASVETSVTSIPEGVSGSCNHPTKGGWADLVASGALSLAARIVGRAGFAGFLRPLFSGLFVSLNRILWNLE